MVDEYGREVDILIKKFSDRIIDLRKIVTDSEVEIAKNEAAIDTLKKAILQRDEYLRRPQESFALKVA